MDILKVANTLRSFQYNWRCLLFTCIKKKLLFFEKVTEQFFWSRWFMCIEDTVTTEGQWLNRRIHRLLWDL